MFLIFSYFHQLFGESLKPPILKKCPLSKQDKLYPDFGLGCACPSVCIVLHPWIINLIYLGFSWLPKEKLICKEELICSHSDDAQLAKRITFWVSEEPKNLTYSWRQDTGKDKLVYWGDTDTFWVGWRVLFQHAGSH